mmetsp:Transcript_64846/g.135212  ORF Transcript_64846/g.135212 Transcript_64846/m.135212 type:complete len:202 (+) Transcript_64846:1293-1898(+)
MLLARHPGKPARRSTAPSTHQLLPPLRHPFCLFQFHRPARRCSSEVRPLTLHAQVVVVTLERLRSRLCIILTCNRFPSSPSFPSRARRPRLFPSSLDGFTLHRCCLYFLAELVDLAHWGLELRVAHPVVAQGAFREREADLSCRPATFQALSEAVQVEGVAARQLCTWGGTQLFGPADVAEVSCNSLALQAWRAVGFPKAS